MSTGIGMLCYSVHAKPFLAIKMSLTSGHIFCVSFATKTKLIIRTGFHWNSKIAFGYRVRDYVTYVFAHGNSLVQSN